MLTGKRIAGSRIKAGMTQEQLAEKLYVTREMVSKWERDICQPDYGMIGKIAYILSVTPDELMTRDEAILNELSGFLPDTESDVLLKALNEFLSTLKRRDRSVLSGVIITLKISALLPEITAFRKATSELYSCGYERDSKNTLRG